MVNADWLTHKRWGDAGHLVLIKGAFDNQRQSDNWRTIEGSIVKRFGAEFTPECSGFKMPRCWICRGSSKWPTFYSCHLGFFTLSLM